ncbi:poly(A) RNA polymerase gld-2 homolog A-like [Cryptotermes secundus]|nr:poly(A) RNA polymerase gld-2 homolog A-like [Cryptotermes secundus]
MNPLQHTGEEEPGDSSSDIEEVTRLYGVYDTPALKSSIESGRHQQQQYFHQHSIHTVPSSQFYQQQQTLQPGLFRSQNFYQSKWHYHSVRDSTPLPKHSHNHLPFRGGRHLNGVLLPLSSGPTPVLIAPDRFLSRSHLVQVTHAPPQLVSGCEWDKLSEGIWNKFMIHQQTEITYRKKILLWKCLSDFIQSSFPRYGLFLVGSTMSGFGSDASDVDMCLLVRHTEVAQRSEAVIHLKYVLKHLRRCKHLTRPELIQAKVPILKFRDTSFSLDVDLNCNNSVGIRNTHLLHCYSQMDWRVRPLVLIVKLWAHKHDINNAQHMTISSYSLVLMVIHFLQCGVAPPVLPCLHEMYQGKFTPHSDVLMIDMHEDLQPFNSDNNQALGELLHDFLRYYVEFDFSQYAISVRLASRVPIEECSALACRNYPYQRKYLCIEEPFDLTNTARSVYNHGVFERVKAVFRTSYNNLKETRNIESIFHLDKND